MTERDRPTPDATRELAETLAHEFNNLLTVILGCGETLASELDDPYHRRLAAMIHQAAERGAVLTRNLLAADPVDLPEPGSGLMIGGNETILVVEDDDLLREHVRGKLENLGYQVVLASTGPEAIDRLEARDDIDLLFTDIFMPGGMNGRELGEQAVGRWPRLRVLYTSGFSGDVLMEDGRLLEGINFLGKPYTKSQLSAKVREVLDAIP